MTALTIFCVGGLVLVLAECTARLLEIACSTIRMRSEARYHARKTAYRIRAYEDAANRADTVEGRARALAISYSLRGDLHG